MEARLLPPRVDPRDDPEWYPLHQEDNVPENVVHFDVGHYLASVLKVWVKDGWVTGDACCYWIRGNQKRYLAPDVFVVDGERPGPPPSTYLAWIHSEIRLAVEVGSRRSFRRDQQPKLDRYAEGLCPREYLFYNPANDDLRLFRRVGKGYVHSEPDERGRVWSEAVGIWFGVESPRRPRAYSAEGEPLLSPEEEAARRQAAERQAREAEARAREEVDRRMAAELRFAELEAELARLRASG